MGTRLIACGLWTLVRSEQKVCGLQSASDKSPLPFGEGRGGGFENGKWLLARGMRKRGGALVKLPTTYYVLGTASLPALHLPQPNH